MRISKSDSSVFQKTLIYCAENTEVSRDMVSCASKHIKDKILFRNEVGIFLQINHKNIVKMYKIDHKTQTICLELCKTDLFKLIHTPKYKDITDEQRENIVRDIVCGLEYLHEELGILHRDVKTSNCLVSNKTIKLCDFGQSHKIKDFNSEDLCGTANYLMPDFVKDFYIKTNKKIKNPKVIDIYAFGMLVWELYSNTIPLYKHNSESILKILFESKKEIVVNLKKVKIKKIRYFIKLCMTQQFESFTQIREHLKTIY